MSDLALSSRSWASSLVDLFLPRTCPGCGVVLERALLWCLSCSARFHAASGPLVDSSPPEPLAAVVAATSLETAGLAPVLYRFKYRGECDGVDALVGLLENAWRAADLAEVDAIVAVPLHSRRLRRRGFNQATLLAAPLARSLQIPLLPLLRRPEAGRAQVGLPGAERRANLLGAFAVRPSASIPASVLLVDDVVTTGATLQHCAVALRAGGIERVVGLAVARALPAANEAAGDEGLSRRLEARGGRAERTKRPDRAAPLPGTSPKPAGSPRALDSDGRSPPVRGQSALGQRGDDR